MNYITIKCPRCEHTQGRRNNRNELRCNACWSLAEASEGRPAATKAKPATPPRGQSK